MSKQHLVIVESPAKAKTIEKYLGSDFTVLSSVGHIRSIAKKTKDGTPPIDVANDFATTYEIDSEKKKVIAELKKAVKAADDVWLATDEDREGEAIAWHLCEVLRLDPKTTKRIVFHEITKDAITEAIKQPRTVDMHLVEAQQARQILDRIVGFELSPVVWQKVPGGKSAGRVQSPAVRLLVEREREIEAFEGSSNFKVSGDFNHENHSFSAEVTERFEDQASAHDFLSSLAHATYTVSDSLTSPSKRNPSAPFTTSTLQQEANARLGFGSRATMASAQKLYQAGKITYMRTDSVNLSKQAMASIASYVTTTFGAEYSTVRAFKTKNASAQEAHEAIRPTDISLERASGDEYDQKLYDLIRNRTLASQMSPAQLEKTTVTIRPSAGSREFVAKGEVVLFDGFLKAYGSSKKDPDLLPALKTGDDVTANSLRARQIFARPPARYTEGSLVKKLEELGIGRPSTYATIIGTVQARGYAQKGEGEGEPRSVIELSLVPNGTVTVDTLEEKTGADRGKLVPTSTGKVISDFLSEYFEPIVDYGFTASVEKHFDDIATNQLGRTAMLRSFYGPFHERIEKSSDIKRADVAKAREIGIDPKTKKPVFARFGRFGPIVQLGATDDEAKPQFAPMPRGKQIETITLEEALHAFQLPRIVGHTEDDQEIKANIGRFGPYIQVGSLFVSIKPHDPHDIDEATARQLYAEKLQKEAEKFIADLGDGIQILKGRWGAYITDGTKNARVPKDTEPTSITIEVAKELLAKAPAKKRTARRATASRKKRKK